MATADHQPAEDTRKSLMYWLQVMYKLACGNQGISASATLEATFPNQFTKRTDPKLTVTLKDLLLGRTTGYQAPDIPHRALGVCMHIISDSYAVGHTQRQLLNPADLAPRDSEGYIVFKPGTTARFGDIVAFHNYTGQDEHRHTHYDQLIGNMPNPNDPATFNSILGARDAIDKLTSFLNFFAEKSAWTDVEKFLTDEVFALDKNVQPGDTNVDSGIYLDKTFLPYVSKVNSTRLELINNGDDWEYEQIVARKMKFLEAGFAQDDNKPGHSHRVLPRRTRWFGALKTTTKGMWLVSCFVMAVALGIFLHRLCSVLC